VAWLVFAAFESGAGDVYPTVTRYPAAMARTCNDHLAERLTAFRSALVVCRFYDHPLIRKLYPPGGKHWRWEFFEGRRQTNDSGPEVLITNRVEAA
jgi:hypothetical protein